MLTRIVLACVAGAIAFLICILVGGLLGSVGIPFVVVVGAFLVQWAAVIGLLVALGYFFSGRTSLFS
jgi:hypothetical protein